MPLPRMAENSYRDLLNFHISKALCNTVVPSTKQPVEHDGRKRRYRTRLSSTNLSRTVCSYETARRWTYESHCIGRRPFDTNGGLDMRDVSLLLDSIDNFAALNLVCVTRAPNSLCSRTLRCLAIGLLWYERNAPGPSA